MTEVRRRILIVEDERIVARDLQRRLSRFGFDVAGVAATGEDAIAIALRERPDLVLMDIRLQGEMDGITAAERIRASASIPIVFLTAYSDDATLRAARITEPFGYILKPFEERELRVVIELALYKHAAERERAIQEERLRRSQKLDAIGQLAGGIAHDFNNVLMVILTNCHTLLEDLSGSERAHTKVALIRAAAERAARMTKQLLVFGREEKRETMPIDLGVVVTGMAALLRPLIGDDVVLVPRIAANLRPILGYATDLEQIILNLVVNARDAMPLGGTITVSVRNGADGVQLSVSDTGVGIDESARQHMFEPFFTTKDVGEGTGLGLATVYSLVTKSGGRIEVDSIVGAGSTFTLWWPATDQALIAQRSSGSEANAKLAGTVMVVEDDDYVRSLICTILRGAGLEVLEARDGIEALQVCGANRVDLVLSDVVMPRMGGGELSEKLAIANPGTKIVYMSGYPDRSIPGGRANVTPMLLKPFTPTQLLDAIRSVMASS